MMMRSSVLAGAAPVAGGLIVSLAVEFSAARRDCRGPFVERVCLAHVAPETLVGLPAFDGRDLSGSAPSVGAVTAAHVDRGLLIVTVALNGLAPIGDLVAALVLADDPATRSERLVGDQRVLTRRPDLAEIHVAAARSASPRTALTAQPAEALHHA